MIFSNFCVKILKSFHLCFVLFVNRSDDHSVFGSSGFGTYSATLILSQSKMYRCGSLEDSYIVIIVIVVVVIITIRHFMTDFLFRQANSKKCFLANSAIQRFFFNEAVFQ